MAVYFEKDRIEKDVPGIIIMSHGPMAVSTVESMKMIMGDDLQNVAAFSLEPGESAEDYSKKVEEALELFPEGSILFADIMGGTPFNTVVLLARKTEKVLYSATGFNLPMLIELASDRVECSGKELLNKIYEMDDHGIFNITEFLESHL